jgi:hypothetical protein
LPKTPELNWNGVAGHLRRFGELLDQSGPPDRGATTSARVEHRCRNSRLVIRPRLEVKCVLARKLMGKREFEGKFVE